MKTFFILIFAAFLSLNCFGQVAPANVGVAEVYLAKDDGNGTAGDAAEKFQINDIPIYCVVQLDSVKSATVKMTFVAVNVKGVKAETKVITVSYKTNGNQDRVNFTGKPDKFWTAGNYRVDIFVDDKLAGSKSFEIEKPANAAPAVNSFQPKQTPKSKPVRKPRKN